MSLRASRPATLAGALGLVAVASLAGAQAATPAAALPDAVARQHEVWRQSLARTRLPDGACFKASYPSSRWVPVRCGTAPARPYLPRSGRHGYTVGDGNDDVAVAPGLISSGVGSIPGVTGVTLERGSRNQANVYSLQLNANFFKSAVCNGAANPSSCQGWQQFVYSNEGIAFMQYWLIDYATTCPSGGWMAYGSDCYRNSRAVTVPTQVIAQLANLKITGTAVAGGTDTMMMTTASAAYSTTGADSVVDLASGWGAAEYNIVGDGGGSAAKFNRGSKLTVGIALMDGTTAAPACQGGEGTTAETNNLTLGACTVAGGTTPSISFTESH